MMKPQARSSMIAAALTYLAVAAPAAHASPATAAAMQSESAQGRAEAAWNAGNDAAAVAIWRTGAEAGEAEAQFRALACPKKT